MFLKPLEQLLGVTRSELSIVFGLSTVSYTLGANAIPFLFGRLPAWGLILLSTVIGALGMLLASQATGIIELALGYGLLFGVGSGIGFCVAQQCVNLLVARHRGLVNGYLISLFPMGAMLAAPLLGWAIAQFGARLALLGLAALLTASGILGIAFIGLSGARIGDAASGGASGRFVLQHKATFWKMFVVFLLAAAAGLTVLSQAAGIVQAYGGDIGTALAATTGITAAIAIARITGGWLVDRLPIPHVAVGAQLLAVAGAVLLTLVPTVAACIVAINMIGVGYGLVSGVMAGSVAAYWERNAYGRIASRMYVAWCIAAISLPVLAARLFDLTDGYQSAIIIAGGCSLLAVGVGALLPRQRLRGEPAGHG